MIPQNLSAYEICSNALMTFFRVLRYLLHFRPLIEEGWKRQKNRSKEMNIANIIYSKVK